MVDREDILSMKMATELCVRQFCLVIVEVINLD